MLNQYEMRINKLIKTHCVNYDFEENIGFLSTEEFTKKLGKHVIENNLAEKRYAIWGAGHYTINLLGDDSIDKSQIICIIDNDPAVWETEIGGIVVKRPSALTNYDIENILINVGNKSICDEIRDQISSINNNIYTCTVNEARERITNQYWCVHFDIFKCCYKYDRETECVSKKLILEKLIALYLIIRDFLNAFKFIELYLEHYEKSHNYETLRKELKLLLCEINEKLANKKSRDVLILMYDNLRAGEIYNNVEQMPYLNRLVEEGFAYTQAYSPGIHTVDSMAATFLKKTNFDYYSSREQKEKSPLIEAANLNNYNLTIYTSLYVEKALKQNIKECDGIFDTSSRFLTTSEIFWKALTDLCDDKQKTMKYLYFNKETHAPCMGAVHDTSTKKFSFVEYTRPEDDFFIYSHESCECEQEVFNNRHAEALNYVDKQTEFYLNMFPKNIIKIIYADHSRYLKGFFLGDKEKKNLLINSNSYHVPLIIHGENIVHGSNSNVFSTAYLTDVIVSVLQNGELPVSSKGVAEVGFSGYYNAKRKKNALTDGDKYAAYGFYLAIDDKYKLVIDSENELHCFAMDNETEEINDEELQKVIYDRLYKYVEKWKNR